MVQIKLFEGWRFEDEINKWIASENVEIIDVKIQFVGSEDESYPFVLVLYRN